MAAVLAAIGLPVSIFHRVDQASGGIGSFCELNNPCSSRWVNHFGFVTIPTMAGAGFAAIVALVAVAVGHRNSGDLGQEPPVAVSGPIVTGNGSPRRRTES